MPQSFQSTEKTNEQTQNSAMKIRDTDLFKKDKLFALKCDIFHTLICRYLCNCAPLLYY